MALRNLTKVPNLCLVYFAVDKSTCVIETKKMRSKETGKLFSETAPNARDVRLRSKVEASCWKLRLLRQVVSSVAFSDLFPDH